MTVTIDESRMEGIARSSAKSEGWDFPYFIDVIGDLKRSLNFQDPPFTIIVDKSGKIVWRHTGYKIGDEIELFEKIKKNVSAQ